MTSVILYLLDRLERGIQLIRTEIFRPVIEGAWVRRGLPFPEPRPVEVEIFTPPSEAIWEDLGVSGGAAAWAPEVLVPGKGVPRHTGDQGEAAIACDLQGIIGAVVGAIKGAAKALIG